MKLIPSIDLWYGEVVRLRRGNVNYRKIYSKEPLKVLKLWEEHKADMVHVVDLNSALGKGNNFEIIQRLLKNSRIPIQVGGGIRSYSLANKIISLGAEKVSLGTLAFENLEEFKVILRDFGEKVTLALDYSSEKVMIRGWKKDTGINLFEAIKRFKELKVKTFLLTNVNRDGTLKGLDLEVLGKVAKQGDVNIIASGGIKGYEDLLKLKKLRLYGVILGRALYEGLIRLDKAREILS